MNFLQPNNRIYHYCSLKVALELILPDFKLLLSKIENTNDPRETKSYWFKHNDFYFMEEDINDLRGTDSAYSNILRSDCKVLCFSTDKDHFWGSLLSKMWAHYADNHCGICLEIDKEKFMAENSALYDFSLFKKVTYFRFNPNILVEKKAINHKMLKELGKENYLKNVFRRENLDYLFFTKTEEWSNEVEVRLIHFSDKSENEYCSIRNSLANVHVGVNFHRSYLPAIKALLASTEVKIVGQQYGDVGLNFEIID